MIDVNLQGKAGAFELNVAFAVPSTGVTGIFGPSASGKTTLLRAIAGLAPMSGHVKIGDKVWQENGKSVPVHKRRVGLLFQEPSLFTHLNVLGNLEFAAKRHPASPINIADVVANLSLKPLLSRSVGKLSGGERQRVALARALLSGPKVLLMDEPLSSLDEASKDEILSLISNVCNRYAVPVLYVSHDLAEIARLTDSVLHMAGGRLTEPRTPIVAPSLLGLSDAEIHALALKAILAGL